MEGSGEFAEGLVRGSREEKLRDPAEHLGIPASLMFPPHTKSWPSGMRPGEWTSVET